MARKVVVAVASALFGVIATLGVLLVDMHDRQFPQGLGTNARVSLDFARSTWSDDRALAELVAFSDRQQIVLVRVAPQTGAGESGNVFVAMSEHRTLPGEVRSFTGVVSDTRPLRYLEGSFAGGQYLVSADEGSRRAFQSWLAANHVGSTWVVDTPLSVFEAALRLPPVAVVLAAVLALATTANLYWLAVRARGRAIRVLGGAPEARIHAADLGAFAVAMLAGLVVAGVIGAATVGWLGGIAFVGYFAQLMGLLGGAVMVLTTAAAVAMSLLARPSAEFIARRKSASRGIVTAVRVVKVVVVLVLAVTIGPAFSAFEQANESASQLAFWERLSNRVGAALPSGLTDADFGDYGARFRAAVTSNRAGLKPTVSYAPEGSFVGHNGKFTTFALVNPEWLSLVGVESAHLLPVSVDELPAATKALLGEQIGLWTTSRRPASFCAGCEFSLFAPTAPLILMRAGSGGTLVQSDETLLVVVRDIGSLNPDDLTSMASTANITFDGLEVTRRVLRDNGLATMRVHRIAEEGLLRSRYATYFAWLHGVATIGLLVSATLVLGIGAFLTAMMAARRNFPLLLSGELVRSVVRGALTRDVALVMVAGILAAALCVAGAQYWAAALTGVFAVLVGLVACAAHVLAARAAFVAVRDRRV